MNVGSNIGLSYGARKALSVHVGEGPATEIANLIQRMAAQIEELKRGKVNVTSIVPESRNHDDRSIVDAYSGEAFY